jgi:hypothetical protein
MAGSYRVRYRRDDCEIEVESADSKYVDKKLRELMELTQISMPKGKSPVTARPRRTPATGSGAGGAEGGTTDVDITAVVNAIHEADNSDEIEKNILERAAQLPRILLCFYFAGEQGTNGWLTTAQVEAITDQLDVKILARNVATTIKKEGRKYLTADRVPHRGGGGPVRYRISRKGKRAFEQLVRGMTP